MRFDLNWQPMLGDFLELGPGLNIRHAPGHTPGLCILQINLPNSGAWVFTSDMYHVKENYEASIPQGWLMRDFDGWMRSNQMVKSLVKRTKANVILGHDVEYFERYTQAPDFHS
jgi:glyoxylase-like metal-dependent hydrolase (beta-lactamase superfamily II)